MLQAVDDVSVEIAAGEFFGIIGRNGSGKSTLLKCLAGIYDIDSGELHVRGRLSPFIELGVGFNLDLTARDNVMINAIMLGLSRQQARARFDDIIAFAELEDFLDMRLKNYSSGMHVRLAFSVAIQVDAEILLIDEVLAVGDARFQQKCFDEFQRLKREGRTILFVTHDMSAIERFCDRAMLLDKGRMIDDRRAGARSPAATTSSTSGARSTSSRRDRRADERAGEPPRRRDRRRLVRGRRRARGSRRSPTARPCAACIEVHFNAAARRPDLRRDAAQRRRRDGVRDDDRARPRADRALRAPARRSSCGCASRPGSRQTRYTLTPSIARAGMGADAIDLRADLASIVVHGGHFTTGVVDLPHEFEIERL